MKHQLSLLVKLQELDSRIGVLQGALDAVPKEIEKYRGSWEEAERALESGKARLEEAQKRRREAERKLDAHLEKITKLNDQQSRVKTNKEYQALMSEVRSLKEKQETLEDNILTLMESAAGEEEAIGGLKAAVAREKELFDREKARLLAEGEELKGQLEGLEMERTGVTPGISEDFLQTYSRVRSIRGDALAVVVDEICQGCRVSVPPQKYADVIIGEAIQTCSHCNRILYFEGERPPARPPRDYDD